MKTERFWSKVEKTSTCWNWTGAIGSSGYGSVSMDGSWYATHRISYIMEHGPIPEGMFVCHHCDNKRCVRPSHLFLGTPAENLADASRKGRMKSNPPRGEAQHKAKLTDDNVRYIRDLFSIGFTQQELAAMYRVARGTVNKVVNRKSWSHVS